MPEGGFFIMADTSAYSDDAIDEKYKAQVKLSKSKNKIKQMCCLQ